ncbi:FRG domain-containing protein [Flavobacterium sp. TSSA_36]|uniref:FRG domain-containing protein n=1 Tax=Flavobacterium sp. TSSA_36 TaxID=3447669 RepID=UPI003F363A9E
MRITSYQQLYNEVITKVQWARFGRNHMENYRGHALREYELLPGLGRYNYENEELKAKEKCLYENFLKQVEDGAIDAVRKPFKNGDYFEIKNYWYSLFQAQHLGLKTRLMDWSIGWETALMFAVNEEKHHGRDGSFWIYFCQRENLFNVDNIEEITAINPLEFKGDAMINSPLYMFDEIFDIIGEKRMGRQSGRFWVQSIENSKIPLNFQPQFAPYLNEIIIDGNSKAAIKQELTERGITLDWHYYRNDENINIEVKKINESCL